MRPEPRHAGELRSVRQLVQREPEAELRRGEGETLLGDQDVRPDEVDDVADGITTSVRGRLGVVVRRPQQVVLAQHAARHPSEHRAELDGAQGAAHPRRSRRVAIGGRIAQQRLQQTPEGGNVRVDPARPVNHLCTGVARGVQAGLRSDELGSDRHKACKIVSQGSSEVRTVERLGARGAHGNAARKIPVHMFVIGHVASLPSRWLPHDILGKAGRSGPQYPRTPGHTQRLGLSASGSGGRSPS